MRYLVIHAETPFFGKRTAGENMWIALDEFYCGESEQNKLHCLTVIVNDPSTNEHRFMKPDEVMQPASGDLFDRTVAPLQLGSRSYKRGLLYFAMLIRELLASSILLTPARSLGRALPSLWRWLARASGSRAD
jgi:hypothetical protein